MTDGHWVIIIGALVGVSCSLVGVFLVLRRLAMLGDAISHSVLLGIVVTLILVPKGMGWLVLIGAGAVGVLTAAITDLLNRHARLQEDASIGVTFTFLFAVAVILISLLGSDAHIDADCILYGEIAFAPFDTISIGGTSIGPRSFWSMLGVTVINLLFVILAYRPLKLITFNPVLATTLGINVALWHYLLMAAVSVTTVAAFDSVGAILVVAMLVVPANASYLVAKSLSGMIVGAVIISIISSAGGYYLAHYFDGSISAGIVLVCGICFLVTLTISQLQRSARFSALRLKHAP